MIKHDEGEILLGRVPDAKPKLPIVCPSCGQSFSAPLPELEVANNIFVSVITAAHERLVRCICGQHFGLFIAGAQAAWQAVPVGDDVVERVNGSKIIVPKLTLAN